MNRGMRAAIAAGATVGVPALVNLVVRSRAQAPPSTLGGQECYYSWRGGDIFYAAAGQGSPLLLVHGIGAGASSYEWQQNFMQLSETFSVYALDLLGFGLSDRPKVHYRAHLYVDLLHDFIEEVIGMPTNAIGSSLSAAYLVENAARAPESFLRLMLVCPAGVSTLHEPPGVGGQVAVRLMKTPVWGQAVYNVMASHPAVAHELKDRLFANPANVTPAMIRHYYLSSHQPGALGPIAAFVGDRLNLDVAEAFASLALPVKLVWGAQATYAPLADAAAWLDLNQNAELTVLDDAGMLPHNEQPLQFNRIVEEQLAGR